MDHDDNRDMSAEVSELLRQLSAQTDGERELPKAKVPGPSESADAPSKPPVPVPPKIGHRRDVVEDILPLLILGDTGPEEVWEEGDATKEETCPMLVFGLGDEQDEQDEKAAPQESTPMVYGVDLPDDSPLPTKRQPGGGFGTVFQDNFPRPGDTPAEWLRKCLHWFAWLVLIAFLLAVAWVLGVDPLLQQKAATRQAEAFHSGEGSQIAVENAPDGMLPAFCGLYRDNPEVAGWLRFTSAGSFPDGDAFLSIDAPVMFSGDNQKYLSRGADGSRSSGGSLFFDGRCHVSDADQDDRVRVIYGNEKAAAGAVADLAQLVGSVQYARASTELQLTTLFEQQKYRVFAVVVTDESAQEAHYFDTRRMQFSGNDDFLAYIQSVKVRSLFHYPVEVTEEDSLLVLTTTASFGVSKLQNGRLTVYAKRLIGEETAFNASQIQVNQQVIMPYAWYIGQGKELHSYYDDGELPVAQNSLPTTQQTSTTADLTTSTTAEATTTTTTATRRPGTAAPSATEPVTQAPTETPTEAPTTAPTEAPTTAPEEMVAPDTTTEAPVEETTTTAIPIE